MEDIKCWSCGNIISSENALLRDSGRTLECPICHANITPGERTMVLPGKTGIQKLGFPTVNIKKNKTNDDEIDMTDLEGLSDSDLCRALRRKSTSHGYREEVLAEALARLIEHDMINIVR